MAFDVKITGPGPLKRSYADIFRQRSQEAILRMGLRVKDEFVKRSLGLAVSGQMASSWAINPAAPIVEGKKVKTRVVSQGPGGIEALVWEKGTRPGRHPFPPTGQGSPLRRWVRRRLGIGNDKQAGRVAKAVAFSIKRRGLPNPNNAGRRKVGVFSRAFKKVRPELNVIGREMQRRIAIDFARNR